MSIQMQGPRSEATRAILAFIKANAPVLHSDLSDAFRPQAAAVGMSAARWLAGRLDNMVSAGFIKHGARGWVLLMEPPVREEKQQKRPHRGRAAEPQTGGMALPRRISMFDGGVYMPAPQVARAGSLDYASAPSVINGERRDYRRGW